MAWWNRYHCCCNGFSPELRVGGMQIFRAEGFDTLGKFTQSNNDSFSNINNLRRDNYSLRFSLCMAGMSFLML